ncbi:MAG: hypothetical protein AAGJ79_13445 [Verrucomicrobiota bacterium]
MKILSLIPLKFLLVLTVIGLAVEEQYPFSHYPMYSNFDGIDYFVFITDQNGEPLPCKVMHTSAAKLKKRFNGKIKKAARAADVRERELDRATLATLGRETLESYMGQTDRDGRMEAVTEIRLIRVDLLAEDKEITKTEWQVASLPFPPAD